MVADEGTVRRTSFPYLPSLDGLRGLLVFPVVAYHFSVTEWGGDALASGSYFAPSMFFALSGFLITSLLLVEHERTEAVDWRGFWARRFRRLIPASVAVVLGCSLAGVLVDGLWNLPAGDVIAGLFSVKNWQSIRLESIEPTRLLGPLSPYWSLAVEEQFYIGLSIVVALAFRSKRPLRSLVAMLTVVWLWSAVSLVAVVGSPNRELFGTDTRASEMVAGCLLAVVVHLRGWPTRRWWGTVGWISLGATAIAWITVDEHTSWIFDGGLLAISVLNIGMICGAVVEGSFGRVMQWRPLVELGRISYPVYLVHWPVTVALNSDRVGVAGWPLIVLRFVVSIALGVGIAKLVEGPIRSRRILPGRQFIAAWAAAATTAALVSWATYGG